jgi:hypothetical protein
MGLNGPETGWKPILHCLWDDRAEQSGRALELSSVLVDDSEFADCHALFSSTVQFGIVALADRNGKPGG